MKEKSNNRFVINASVLLSLLANFPIIDIGLRRMDNAPPEGMPPLGEMHAPGSLGFDLLAQLIISFAFAFLLISLLNKASRPFSIWKSDSRKTFGLTTLLYLLFNIVILAISSIWVGDISHIVGSVITRGILLLISCIFLSNFIRLQENKQHLFRENEALKQQNLKSQIEVLRNQLNPHFFFNTLNTLSWLINEDTEKSQLYLTRLSSVLRSSLEMQKRSLIPLTKELELADAYMHLVSIRYGVNVSFRITNNAGDNWQLPPMCVQLLIENAIKHNVITSELPLHISILIDPADQVLIFRNDIQEKIRKDSSGIGLVNLDARFNLLSGKSIEINNQNGTFEVRLPLIPVS